MQSNDFEKVFGDFLERKEYDEAQGALFTIVRKSFEAGWNAAGGDPPAPQKIFEIVKGEHQKSEDEPDNRPEE